MRKKRHRFVLLGGNPGELRVPASVLHEAMGFLLEGARRATRFFFEGESTRKGPRPAWLNDACELEITALSPGSAIFDIDAPLLGEVLPQRFGRGAQLALFNEPEMDPSKLTSVDILGRLLVRVVEGDEDEVMADRALLDTFLDLARTARGAFEGIRFEGIAGIEKPVVVHRALIPRMERLRNETPPSRAVRVTGVLDTISASRPDFVLVLPHDIKVPARLENHDAEMLKELFGRRVVVSGIARYRPSGKLLLIDVESIAAAGERDDIFEALPMPRPEHPPLLFVPQDETSGVSAFFGTWPGDESDEELIEALRSVG